MTLIHWDKINVCKLNQSLNALIGTRYPKNGIPYCFIKQVISENYYVCKPECSTIGLVNNSYVYSLGLEPSFEGPGLQMAVGMGGGSSLKNKQNKQYRITTQNC